MRRKLVFFTMCVVLVVATGFIVGGVFGPILNSESADSNDLPVIGGEGFEGDMPSYDLDELSVRSDFIGVVRATENKGSYREQTSRFTREWENITLDVVQALETVSNRSVEHIDYLQMEPFIEEGEKYFVFLREINLDDGFLIAFSRNGVIPIDDQDQLRAGAQTEFSDQQSVSTFMKEVENAYEEALSTGLAEEVERTYAERLAEAKEHIDLQSEIDKIEDYLAYLLVTEVDVIQHDFIMNEQFRQQAQIHPDELSGVSVEEGQDFDWDMELEKLDSPIMDLLEEQPPMRVLFVRDELFREKLQEIETIENAYELFYEFDMPYGISG